MRALYLEGSGPMRVLHSASMLMDGMSSSTRVIVHQDHLSPERAPEWKLQDVLTEVGFVLRLIFRGIGASLMEVAEVASFIIELRILQQVGDLGPVCTDPVERC